MAAPSIVNGNTSACRAGATPIGATPVHSSMFGGTPGANVFLLFGINITSVSDTKSNTWEKLAEGGPLSLWGARLNSVYAFGDTITVNSEALQFNTRLLVSPVSGTYLDRSGGDTGTVTAGSPDTLAISVGDTRYDEERVVTIFGATFDQTYSGNVVISSGPTIFGGCHDGTTQGGSSVDDDVDSGPGTLGFPVVYNGTITGAVSTPAGATYTWGALVVSFIGTSSDPIISPGEGDPSGSQLLSRDRGSIGTLRQARVSASEQLLVDIYNDNFPEAVTVTNTIESSGVTACSLRVLRGQFPKKTHKGLKRTNTDIWYLIYLHSGAVKYRTSRDLGATWGVATTITSGYHGVVDQFDMHPLRGLWVVTLYDKTNTKWRITVGSMLDDGTWSFSTIRDLVTSAANAAFLKVRPDGIWEFTYRTSGGSISTIRCRNLLADGTGTWS